MPANTTVDRSATGGTTMRSFAPRSLYQPYGGSDKTVDVHLHWLRRKLGESADKPHYLHRVRGVGVKMVDPGP